MAYPIYQYPPMMQQPIAPAMAPQPISPQIPQYNNPMVGPQQAPQTNYSNGKTWVSGEAGAKAYLVAPNTDVTLWDSEAQTIYLKAADANGMPNMKILDYTIRGAEKPVQPLADTQPNDSVEYVLKSDFDALKEELEALKEDLKKVPRQVNKPNNKGGSKL